VSDDILFERRGGLGLVTLNRPKALNALTHDMALALERQLIDWAGDPAVQVVAITAAGDKAFCAGGDIRALYAAGPENGARNFGFYADEYRLNTRIHRYPKPYVAFMDGIVMGGGVGIAIHGSHRVAGDATLFAMPETGIGLFPDVGGTWFLPRLAGQTGLWLGLTGARLKAADTVEAGVCDLFVPSANRPDALAALETCAGTREAVDAALAPFAARAEGATLPGLRPQIDRLFGAGTLHALMAGLEADGGDWAARQRQTIATKSPTSTALAFRQLQMGARLDFASCMKLEYRLARFCMTHPDFYEGVRAVIIDKDNAPRWTPPSLDALDPAVIDSAFADLGPAELDLAGL
jgi:enoyl-CoA hydratase/carnithine racemase